MMEGVFQEKLSLSPDAMHETKYKRFSSHPLHDKTHAFVVLYSVNPLVDLLSNIEQSTKELQFIT